MKRLLFLSLLSLFFLSGCTQKETNSDQDKSDQTIVLVGESYESVLDRLGSPNVNSISKNSRVLIYDEIEIELQDNVVSVVYDHRDS